MNQEDQKVQIILTAKQIAFLSEISVDTQAVNKVLEMHISFAHNRINELEKSRHEWWEEMAEIHGLDLPGKQYGTKTINGAVCIYEKQK